MFLKQRRTNTQDATGQKLYWGRAAESMAPFRGAPPPLLKEHEYEDAVERTWDCKCAIFDMSQPDQLQNGVTYQTVDNVMATWWHVLKRSHKWVKRKAGVYTMLVYIEWAEPYDEPNPEYLNRVL